MGYAISIKNGDCYYVNDEDGGDLLECMRHVSKDGEPTGTFISKTCMFDLASIAAIAPEEI